MRRSNYVGSCSLADMDLVEGGKYEAIYQDQPRLHVGQTEEHFS